MTCTRCSELCVTYRIRSPGELDNALRIASGNLQAGTIEEVAPTPGTPILEPKVPFASVVAGTDRPDFVNFRFR